MIYKGETITEISNQDNADYYFHIPLVDDISSIKSYFKQTLNKERQVTILGVEYCLYSCLKSDFKVSWGYEELTQGEAISVMEYFDPQPEII